jgi:PAS domain S-box-containing protein
VLDITEQKKARKKLEESEQRYRTTFEHTGTAMVIIEEDTTLSLVNSEFEKLSGYRKEEIEGKFSWTKFVHPDDLERMKGYHYARRRGEEAPKRYEFRFIDKEGNLKNIFLAIDLIPGTKKTVASLIDITHLKRLNNLLGALSEINELVAREKSPEIVLKAVCEKLTLVYDAAFTSLLKDGDLVPVESKGIDMKSIKRAIKRCPSVSKAMNGETAKMRMNDELCKHCTDKPHKHVLSIPLIHEKHYGVITIHSSSEFREDEIALLEKLSKNIAFALGVYEIEKREKMAVEQLVINLMQLEKSADRLRNPLAVIMSSLELKDELGSERTFKLID